MPAESTADDLFDAALRHYRQGRLAAAVDACRTLLAAAPGDGETLNLLGVALLAGGDTEAAAILAEAARRMPGHAAVLTNLIVALHAARSWKAADEAAQRLAVLQPEAAFAWSRLAASRQELGDLEASVRFQQRVVRVEASSLALFNLLQCNRAAGRRPEALNAARCLAILEPDSAAAQTAIGTVQLTLGDADAAAAAFRRAAILDPAADDVANGLTRSWLYQAAHRSSGVGPAPGAPVAGVVMRGMFRTISGYGHFTERFLRMLRRRGVPVHTIGLTGPETWEQERLDRPVAARVALQCVIPLAIEPVPGHANVVFTMFEATRIPPAWRRASEAADLIVVPTRSSYAAWAEMGFPEDRLRLCPLGVDPSPTGGGTLALVDPNGRNVAGYRHRFLNLSDTLTRKNLDGLLRVWLRATRAGDDAVLILKLGKAPSAEIGPWLAGKVAAAEQATGHRLGGAAPVVVLDRNLNEAEMDALFRTATYYWSLSHGEGWDLPMTRAGAMGLGLIAPRHSAYVDYLDDSVARLIPARVEPAWMPYSRDYWKVFHGLDWWVPDEDAAVAILADIIRNDAALPSARDRLVQHFSWDQATDRLQAILAEAAERGRHGG